MFAPRSTESSHTFDRAQIRPTLPKFGPNRSNFRPHNGANQAKFDQHRPIWSKRGRIAEIGQTAVDIAKTCFAILREPCHRKSGGLSTLQQASGRACVPGAEMSRQKRKGGNACTITVQKPKPFRHPSSFQQSRKCAPDHYPRSQPPGPPNVVGVVRRADVTMCPTGTYKLLRGPSPADTMQHFAIPTVYECGATRAARDKIPTSASTV